MTNSNFLKMKNVKNIMCRINYICDNCLYLEKKITSCVCFNPNDRYIICKKCKDNNFSYKSKYRSCNCNIL